MGIMVQVKLVLTDWRKDGRSVYNSRHELSNGVFHGGTTFDGGIVVETADEEDELRQALAEGYEPVFVVRGSGYDGYARMGADSERAS